MRSRAWELEQDHYAVLGVSPTSPTAEIRRAHRRLALIYHPDRFQGCKALGEATMKRINRAATVLTDGEERARYDRLRAARSPEVTSYRPPRNPAPERARPSTQGPFQTNHVPPEPTRPFVDPPFVGPPFRSTRGGPWAAVIPIILGIVLGVGAAFQLGGPSPRYGSVPYRPRPMHTTQGTPIPTYTPPTFTPPTFTPPTFTPPPAWREPIKPPSVFWREYKPRPAAQAAVPFEREFSGLSASWSDSYGLDTLEIESRRDPQTGRWGTTSVSAGSARRTE